MAQPGRSHGAGGDDLEEQLEWEERRSDVPIALHMVAGSCAGVAEHICMYPIDTFKVRCGFQAPRFPCRRLPSAPPSPSFFFNAAPP